MTALKEFQRLEAPGLWRQGEDAQRRDVIVSFGDASLVVSDKNETALTHWSLAAVHRVNPSARPALFSPGPDSSETLEIDDEVMIGAINKVSSAIERARPRPGRLRLWLAGSGALTLAALLTLWMPGALRHHTASVVPASMRAEIGTRLLGQITRVTGAPCRSPEGTPALSVLSQRVLERPGSVMVVPAGVAQATHLPGGLVVLGRAIIEDYDDADVAAGFILAEETRAAMTDPVLDLLESSSLLTSIKLLTTGKLSERALNAYGEALLTRAPATLDSEMLLGRFETTQVPSTPYAYALDVSGETVLDLIEADPLRGKAHAPVLNDSNWVRLQGLCGG